MSKFGGNFTQKQVAQNHSNKNTASYRNRTDDLIITSDALFYLLEDLNHVYAAEWRVNTFTTKPRKRIQ